MLLPLTSYRLPRLCKGDCVTYRGDPVRIFGIYQESLLLELLDSPTHEVIKVTFDDVLQFTMYLEAAHCAFVRDMAEHKRKVRSRQYTSVYFPKAPAGY